MMAKITLTFLIVVVLVLSADSQTLGTGGSGVTQNYIPDYLMNKTTSERITATEVNCSGYPTTPFMPGMFQYDGDIESFASASHGTSTQCVATTYTITHNMAPFQDNTCPGSAWKVSHGTPEVGINQGNRFMHIWSGNWTTDGDFEGEGLFYDCELLACANYNISLRLSSTSTISKIYFYIASGLQHKSKDGNEWNPESSFYKVPSVTSAYLIHSITNFNSGVNNWVTISLPAFAPPNSGMKFWIFTEDSKINVGQVGADLLFIDDVTDGLPGSSSTCVGNINYSSGTIPPFSRANTITASISTTLASTEFIGGSTTTLRPGFKTTTNSFFWARINPCVTGNNCPVGCSICRTSSGAVEDENVMQINGQEFYTLNVYPNPSKGEMHIDKPVGEKIINVKLVEEATGREIGFVDFEDLDTNIRFKVDTSFKGAFIFILRTERQSYASRIIIN